MPSLKEIDELRRKYLKRHPHNPRCVCLHSLKEHPKNGGCTKCNCAMFFSQDIQSYIQGIEDAHKKAANSKLIFKLREKND